MLRIKVRGSGRSNREEELGEKGIITRGFFRI